MKTTILNNIDKDFKELNDLALEFVKKYNLKDLEIKLSTKKEHCLITYYKKNEK